MEKPPVLEVRDLSVWYPVRSGIWGRVKNHVQAVRHLDLQIAAGEIVAVVGESGCGKTTLAQALLGLRPWQTGTLTLQGQELSTTASSTWRQIRKQVQMVFQDPFSSLNPRQTVSEILIGPQRVQGVSASKALQNAEQALTEVGLSPADLDKYPHAFSGGQRQRIGIARVLALQSRVIVCDEPTSALDVSVQAQILQLLQDLRARLGISILLISHDLSVVRALADRVLVMYLGSVVESLPASELLQRSRHPYTRALLASVPSLELGKPPQILRGEIPSLVNLPHGCVFAGRCPKSRPECSLSEIPLREIATKQFVRCPWSEEIA